jgi:serine/threonine protein kinase
MATLAIASWRFFLEGTLSEAMAGTTGISEGSIMGGRYALKVPIGEGGMGVVWRAWDQHLDGPVAVKFLKAADENSQRRFFEEAKLAARLVSPHIVRVFDRGTFESTPYIVMELLEGFTLRERLLVAGRLGPEEVCEVVDQVARGLEFMHERGVVHRDLKPGNIFLVDLGDLSFVKLIDLGIAKSEVSEWTLEGGWLGSSHYVSPEQARDASSADHSADVWALAVVAYECLLGRKPFQGSSPTAVVTAILSGQVDVPSSLDPVLPAMLDVLFGRAFSPEVARRPCSATEFARDLRGAVSLPRKRANTARLFGTRSSNLEVTLDSPLSLPAPRAKWRIPLLTMGVLVCGALVWNFWNRRQEPSYDARGAIAVSADVRATDSPEVSAVPLATDRLAGPAGSGVTAAPSEKKEDEPSVLQRQVPQAPDARKPRSPSRAAVSSDEQLWDLHR